MLPAKCTCHHVSPLQQILTGITVGAGVELLVLVVIALVSRFV